MWRKSVRNDRVETPEQPRMAKDVEWFAESFAVTVTAIEKSLRCHRDPVAHALSALVAGGHVLIEDVPGTGKSTLATAVAAATRGTVRSVDLTPDLLPSDLTGMNIYQMREDDWEFRRGSIFANVFIAENLNRASPKTQSALLGAMDSGRVNHERGTYPLPKPFSLIATQNPLDDEGTYPITGAICDRFTMRLEIGDSWLDPDVLVDLLRQPDWSQVSSPIGVVARPARSLDLLRMSRVASTVYIAPQIAHYLIHLTQRISDSPAVRRGVSLRARLSLARLMQVGAATSGRDYVVPDDLHRVAQVALAHRVELSHEAMLSGVSDTQVVAEALAAVSVPS